MKETNWVVVTGPPSSGKTSIIKMLAMHGFIRCPEVARELIVEGLNKNKCPQVETFQREILAITCRREHLLSVKELIFFDRGIPDSIAYFKYNNLAIAPAFKASLFRRYNLIFYCCGLPIIKDGIRQESADAAAAIGQLILEAYQMLNYNPIILPAISLEERFNIILDNI